MKKKFSEALIRGLIKDGGYTPLLDEEGNILSDRGANILIKESFGSVNILELIDGDSMTSGEISTRLSESGDKLSNIKGRAYKYIIEVFLFDSEPEKEKLEVIEEGQIHDALGKKFVKCMSIDCTTQNITKHFKVPVTDFGLEGLVKAQFEGGCTEGISAEEIQEIMRQREEELKIEFEVKTPILTYALIAINIIVFGLITLYGIKSGIDYNSLLFTFGSKENASIMAGEYWRFITPVFLHANIVHLLVNCYSLYAVGATVERMYGYGKFTLIYFAAGLFGSIASFMFSTNPGVGASGAIFGLLGAMLYIGLERPAVFKAYFGHGVILTLVINLFYGFSTPGIDNFAHLGGLIGGFLASGIVGLKGKTGRYQNKYLFLALTLAIASAGLFYGFNSKPNRILMKVAALEKLDKEQRWSEAEKLGEEIREMKPANKRINVIVLWSLARAEAMSGKLDEALEHAVELTNIDPANGHYLQGAIYIDLGNREMARKELMEAKRQGAGYEGIDELIKGLE